MFVDTFSKMVSVAPEQNVSSDGTKLNNLCVFALMYL